jgi:DNA primase
MGLFPSSFIEDLRVHADIVQVVQDTVSLKRVGGRYTGLCPFHGEKTPSFTVNREKGFFHCFGCGTGGDVFKFVELNQQVGFVDAVKLLAQRFGVPLPELDSDDQSTESSAEREALIKVHEAAAGYFAAQYREATGARARKTIADRGLTSQTADTLRVGFAPPQRDALKKHLTDQGYSLPLLVRSGLVIELDDGETIDRFRNRLMFPIARESGSVIGFGGRAMAPDQQPKYLNSPETAIYSKGRTLYGLHLTKGDIRRLGYAVIVEGYFDFAQTWQAGTLPVVASSGTALTSSQAHLLRRFASRVILSFDPDEAGRGAAGRSSELLVASGFQVNVALLPAGGDPDTFIRKEGAAAYTAQLKSSQPYLHYLLDRAAAGHDLSTEAGRRGFLTEMLAVASRIPDAATRDQFADRLAHKAQILEDVVRNEIRKAAAAGRTSLDNSAAVRAVGSVRPAERGLIWAFLNDVPAALDVLKDLDPADLEALAAGDVLKTAYALRDWPPGQFPVTLLERLNKREAELVRAVGEEPAAPAPPADCGRALKRLRFERERTAVQREIDRLQELGASTYDAQINALWARKKDLLHQLHELGV